MVSLSYTVVRSSVEPSERHGDRQTSQAVLLGGNAQRPQGALGQLGNVGATVVRGLTTQEASGAQVLRRATVASLGVGSDLTTATFLPTQRVYYTGGNVLRGTYVTPLLA